MKIADAWGAASSFEGGIVGMSSRPKKRSLTLKGHRTSVSLEDDFWQALQEIAVERQQAVNALAAEIDEGRNGEMGLASALRLFILKYYRERP